MLLSGYFYVMQLCVTINIDLGAGDNPVKDVKKDNCQLHSISNSSTENIRSEQQVLVGYFFKQIYSTSNVID